MEVLYRSKNIKIGRSQSQAGSRQCKTPAQQIGRRAGELGEFQPFGQRDTVADRQNGVKNMVAGLRGNHENQQQNRRRNNSR